jgi:hypothetical protein
MIKFAIDRQFQFAINRQFQFAINRQFQFARVSALFRSREEANLSRQIEENEGGALMSRAREHHSLNSPKSTSKSQSSCKNMSRRSHCTMPFTETRH